LIDTTRFLKYMENKYHIRNFKDPPEKIFLLKKDLDKAIFMLYIYTT